MAAPTLSTIYDLARSYIGDDVTSGGDVFTNTVLAPYFGIAYRELWRAMASVQNPQVKRSVYYVLPANTTVLAPATANIPDLGTPLVLEERGGLTKYAITGGTINASVPSVTFTVAATTGLTAGNFVTISGNMALTATDGLWGIANITPTTFDCLGMVSGGSFSGAGQAVLSQEDFAEVISIPTLDHLFSGGSADVRGNLGEYVWYEGVFHFPPCNADRQLRITYEADGTAPSSTSTTVGLDGLNFLAARTAGLAAGARGNQAEADYLNTLALGPDKNTQNWDGFLGQILWPMVRARQQMHPEDRRKQPFRHPRAPAQTIW